MDTQKIVNNILGKKTKKLKQDQIHIIPLTEEQKKHYAVEVNWKVQKGDIIATFKTKAEAEKYTKEEMPFLWVSSITGNVYDERDIKKKRLKQSSECWHVEFDDGQTIEFPVAMAESRDQAMKVARDQKKQMPGIYAHHLGRIVKTYKKRYQ